MQVILKEDVPSLGEEGQVKNVAAGYARNYLVPRGMASYITLEAMETVRQRKKKIEARIAQKKEDAKSVQQKISDLTLEIPMPCGVTGRLFGAVTPHMVVDMLIERSIDITNKQVALSHHLIKQIGDYSVMVSLYGGATAELKLKVIPDASSEYDEDAAAAKETEKNEAEAAQASDEASNVTTSDAASEVISEPSSETDEA